MSLPLTRRIAQAALLVAAGATPLVAAGVASAADLVPQGTDPGAALSRLDSPNTAATLQGTTHQLGTAAGDTAGATVKTGVPAVADAAAATAATAAPEANKTVGTLAAPAANTAATTGAVTTLMNKLAPEAGDKLGEALDSHVLPAAGTGKVLPAVTQKLAPATPLTRSTPAPALANLGSLVPADALTHGVPQTGDLGSALPDTDHLGNALPATDTLAHGLQDGSLLTVDPLTGHLPTSAAHRLGGLGEGSGLGALGPVGGLLGGVHNLGSLTGGGTLGGIG